MDAVTLGKDIGVQGRSRTIYEVTVAGRRQIIAIEVGENGYVVGANPRRSP